MTSKFSISVVLYNPSFNQLNRIFEISSLGYQFYLFDNSININNKLFKDSTNVKYFSFNKNMGIGFALNFLANKIYIDKFKYFIYFDQDTIYKKTTLSFINNFIKFKISKSREDIFCYNFTSKTSNFKTKEALLCISSGSLFNTKILKKIGWHNKTYFIEGVDYEICLRAKKFNYKLLTVYNTLGLIMLLINLIS